MINQASRRLLLLLSFSLSLLPLPGCWDAKEVQRINYVAGLGVDYERNNFSIYAQIINFGSIAKEEQRNAPFKAWIGSGSGPTVLAAINDLMAGGQGTIFLGHVHYLVLTERVMKAQMLEHVFDFTNRNKETRYTKWFYGTKTDLFKLFSAKSLFDRSSLDSVLGDPEQNYTQLSNLKPYYVNEIVAGMFEPSSTIIVPSIELTDEVWREKATPMPILKKSGGFIFNGTKYMGWMSMSDIMLGRWLQPDYSASPLTLREDSRPIAALEVRNASHVIEIDDQGERPRFTVRLKADAILMGMAVQKPLEDVQKLAEEVIRKQILEYYAKGLAMKADLVHLGHEYYRRSPTRWKALSPSGRLPLAPDSLEKVEVRLRILHAQKYKSPQIKDSYMN